jgi:hypothetical protein
MARPIDLRQTLLKMLQMQWGKIRAQYEFEHDDAKKAKKEGSRVAWSKELREETELAVQIVECLFKVGGGTAEVANDSGKDVEENDFSADEMKAGMEALAKLAKK